MPPIPADAVAALLTASGLRSGLSAGLLTGLTLALWFLPARWVDTPVSQRRHRMQLRHFRRALLIFVSLGALVGATLGRRADRARARDVAALLASTMTALPRPDGQLDLHGDTTDATGRAHALPAVTLSVGELRALDAYLAAVAPLQRVALAGQVPALAP